MRGSRVVSYSRKKRLGNRETGWVTRRPKMTGKNQLGAGGAGPGRAMSEGKVSQIGSRIVESFSSPRPGTSESREVGVATRAEHLSSAIPSGAPCSEKNDCLGGKGRVNYQLARSLTPASQPWCLNHWVDSDVSSEELHHELRDLRGQQRASSTNDS